MKSFWFVVFILLELYLFFSLLFPNGASCLLSQPKMTAKLLLLTYSLLECCIYNNLKREISNSLEKFRILSNLKTGHNTFTNIRPGMRKSESV